MVPLAPAGTSAMLATTCPFQELSVDALGWADPPGPVERGVVRGEQGDFAARARRNDAASATTWPWGVQRGNK